MRAVLFGTYNREHSANRILLRAMRAVGFDVVEIHAPLWERTRDKGNEYFGPVHLLLLALRWIGAALALFRKWRRAGGASLVVCGFNGQLDLLLVRLLVGRRARVVFAPLVSITETLIEDRAIYAPSSLMARLLRLVDLASFALADVVVVDTEEHRRYLIELGAPVSKLVVCHLGADEDAFPFGDELTAGVAARPPVEAKADRPKEVLYFGQYLPLHGLDVVVDAAARLADRSDLRFVFIGTGAERPRVQREIEAAKVSAEFIDWVDYNELGRRVAQADIVLGVFGSSRKASMVIANKVYEAAAMGCSVLTADTAALREVFEPGVEVEVCAPTGRDLALAIGRLADDPAHRQQLGQRARQRVRSRFSLDGLASSWEFPLLGADLVFRRHQPQRPRVGVAIVNFNDALATVECARSLLEDLYPSLVTLVVDNGSSQADAALLGSALESISEIEILRLETNHGYSGANNLALQRLFEAGCEYVLILNNDSVLGRGSLDAMVAAAQAHPAAGPIGPLISKNVLGGPLVSCGERYWRRWVWLPRSLLRVRGLAAESFPVGGVQGCALLISRQLYQACAGFDDDYFAYYEEVDYCLRSRRLGMRPRVEPLAEVAHRGSRGFAAGMTPLAAYLKARNLWIVGARGAGPVGRALFGLGYFPLLAVSAALYRFRGQASVAQALGRGRRAALRGEVGRPGEAEISIAAYRGDRA